MNWKEEYERKMVSADEAVEVIRSDDHVAFAYGLEPLDLSMALIARSSELENIKLFIPLQAGISLGMSKDGREFLM